MILTLKNFKCYEEETFDLGICGLTLISGNSGVGKSTILSAINYVLYSTGNKIIMNGKSFCSVKLEYDDTLIICRKKPNKLLLTIEGKDYEDEVAQSIINNKFGDSFDIVGYIAQSENNFVGLSPINKLCFLEKVAFKNIKLSEMKEKCKEIIKDRNEAFIVSASNLELSKKIFSEMIEPENIPFSRLRLKNKILTDQSIKNEEIRYKNSKIFITRKKAKLDIITKEFNDINILNASIKPKNELLLRLNNKINQIISEYGINYNEEYLICKKKILKKIIMKKEFIIKKQKYEEDLKKITDLEEFEITELNNKLIGIAHAWVDYSKIESLEIINRLQTYLIIIKKYTFLKNMKEEYCVNEEEHNVLLEDIILLENNKLELENNKIELNHVTLNIKNIKENIILYNKFTELKKDEKKYYVDEEKLQEDIEKLQKLRKLHSLNIEKNLYYVNEIELEYNLNFLSNKKLYSCPNCESILRIYNNKLLPQEAQQLENKLENKLDEISYKTIINKLSEIELNNIIQKQLSDNILYKNIINKISEISNNEIYDSSTSGVYIDELNESINNRNTKKIKYNRVIEKLQTLNQSELTVICENILHNNIKLKDDLIENIDRLIININTLNTSISIRNNKKIKYKEIETKMSLYDISQLSKTEEETLEELEYMKLYIQTQNNLENEISLINNKLLNRIFSSTLISLKQDILEQKKQVENVGNLTDGDDITGGENEEEIRNEISNLEKLKELKNEYNTIFVQINLEKKNHIDKYEDTVRGTKDNLQIDIEHILEELNILEKQKDSFFINLENIKKYKEREEYNKWTDKLNILENQLNIDRKKLGLSTLLKEKITLAESIAMESIICCINTHVQIYLNCFFTDFPINVRLMAFKETKNKSKAQINIEINYKNMDNISTTDLSGGEISRLNIAFTLAFTEMFNFPLIMLDESMSSLDEYHSSIVIEGIKENFNGKLCIIVAHQTIEGMYDNILKL